MLGRGYRNGQEDCGCTITEEDAEYGHAAFKWTRSNISEENRKFLSELYFKEAATNTAAGTLLLVHGSLRPGNTLWSRLMILFCLSEQLQEIATC